MISKPSPADCGDAAFAPVAVVPVARGGGAGGGGSGDALAAGAWRGGSADGAWRGGSTGDASRGGCGEGTAAGGLDAGGFAVATGGRVGSERPLMARRPTQTAAPTIAIDAAIATYRPVRRGIAVRTAPAAATSVVLRSGHTDAGGAAGSPGVA